MNKRLDFVRLARSRHGNQITRQEIIALRNECNFDWPNWLLNEPTFRVGRAIYTIPADDHPLVQNESGGLPMPVITAAPVAAPSPATLVAAATHDPVPHSAFNGGQSLVPQKLDIYVPFGFHKDLVAILASKLFFPVYVTGLSGCGKTTTVDQVCHEVRRELFRVNITAETDEDDLLGGYRLIDGNTVWQDGPVVQCMTRGGVLLLDEIDLGSSKIMCLQPVLEGKGVYLKKVNRWAMPKPGFTVVATANTKGKGSDDGKFVGTNVMNEAFLDRVGAACFEQAYPPNKVETKILLRAMASCSIPTKENEHFAKCLVSWANNTRQSYANGAIEDIITTRRLVDIVKAFAITKDKMRAIQLCTNRFDTETQKNFRDLYCKIDAQVAQEEADRAAKAAAAGETATEDETA